MLAHKIERHLVGRHSLDIAVLRFDLEDPSFALLLLLQLPLLLAQGSALVLIF